MVVQLFDFFGVSVRENSRIAVRASVLHSLHRASHGERDLHVGFLSEISLLHAFCTNTCVLPFRRAYSETKDLGVPSFPE